MKSIPHMGTRDESIAQPVRFGRGTEDADGKPWWDSKGVGPTNDRDDSATGAKETLLGITTELNDGVVASAFIVPETDVYFEDLQWASDSNDGRQLYHGWGPKDEVGTHEGDGVSFVGPGGDGREEMLFRRLTLAVFAKAGAGVKAKS
jgi:hypothetical protein